MNLRLPRDLEFRESDVADVHPLFIEKPEPQDNEPSRQNIIPGVIAFLVLVALTTFWLYWVSGNREAANRNQGEPESAVARLDSGSVFKAPVIEREVPRWPESAELRFLTLKDQSWHELKAKQALPAAEPSSSAVALNKPVALVPIVAADQTVPVPAAQLNAVRNVKSAPSPEFLEKERLAEARQLAFTGESYQAKVRLLRFLELHPGSEKARQVLAGWMIRDHQWYEARVLLGEVGLDSHHGIRLLKARVLVQYNEVEAAVRILEYAVPPIAAVPVYHALLGAIYQRQGRFSDAVTVFSGLTRLAQPRSEWWTGLAISLDKAGSHQQALRAYQKMVNLPGLSASLRDFSYQRISLLSRWEG